MDKTINDHLTPWMTIQTSANFILVNTKYNKKTLMAILNIVDSVFFLFVFNACDFSNIVGSFVLRFVVGLHQ